MLVGKVKKTKKAAKVAVFLMVFIEIIFVRKTFLSAALRALQVEGVLKKASKQIRP